MDVSEECDLLAYRFRLSSIVKDKTNKEKKMDKNRM